MGVTVTWIDADGASHPLTDQSNFVVEWGPRGHRLPPVKHVEETVPQHHGARLRTVRYQPREVELPLVVHEATLSALWATVRELLGWFDPTRGDGTLRIQDPDGGQRELVCRLRDGLQGDDREQVAGPTWRRVLLILRAVEPFWQAVSPTVSDILLDAGSGAMFFPFFPIRLTNSTIFNAPVVNNPGEVDAEPIWTVTGPGTDVTLRNLTTGALLGTTTPLLAGQSLAIDTRFGRKTATFDDGSGPHNDYPNLVAGSEFWTLARGDNSLQLEMSGATAASAIRLQFLPRYLGV